MQFKAIQFPLKLCIDLDFLMRTILEFELGVLYLMNNKANFVKACVEYDRAT